MSATCLSESSMSWLAERPRPELLRTGQELLPEQSELISVSFLAPFAGGSFPRNSTIMQERLSCETNCLALFCCIASAMHVQPAVNIDTLVGGQCLEKDQHIRTFA